MRETVSTVPAPPAALRNLSGAEPALRRFAWSVRLPLSVRAEWLREESGNRFRASVACIDNIGEARITAEASLLCRIEDRWEAGVPRLRVVKAGRSPVTLHRLEIDSLNLHPDALRRLAASLPGFDGSPEEWAAALEDWTAFAALPRSPRPAFEELFGPVSSPADHAGWRRAPFGRLAAAVAAALPEAVRRALSARLARLTDLAGDEEVLFEGEAQLPGTPSAALCLGEPAGGAWRGLFSGAIGFSVRLPVLDKKRWAARRGVLGACRVTVPAPGLLRIAPATDPPSPFFEAAFQVLGAVAGALPSGCRGPDIVFSDSRSLSAAQLRVALPRLLDAYGVPAGILDGSARAVAARWCVAMPWQGAAAWREVPRERTRVHARAFSRIAAHLQARLRRWLLYLTLQDPKLFEDRDAVAALAVYAAGRPAPRTVGSDPVFDPMNPAQVRQACRTARAALPELAEALASAAETAGAGATAAFLRRSGRRKLLAGVARGNRRFLHLLEADCTAAESLAALGDRCRRVAEEVRLSSGGPPRFLWKAAAEVDKRFRSRFRRLLGAAGLSHLGVLLLIEATSVLGATLERPVTSRLLVELEFEDGSRRLAAPPARLLSAPVPLPKHLPQQAEAQLPIPPVGEQGDRRGAECTDQQPDRRC